LVVPWSSLAVRGGTRTPDGVTTRTPSAGTGWSTRWRPPTHRVTYLAQAYRPTYELTDTPTWRPTYLPSSLPASKPNYLPSNLPTCRPSCLPASPATFLHMHLPADRPTCRTTYLQTYLPYRTTRLPTNSATYLIAYLPANHTYTFYTDIFNTLYSIVYIMLICLYIHIYRLCVSKLIKLVPLKHIMPVLTNDKPHMVLNNIC